MQEKLQKAGFTNNTSYEIFMLSVSMLSLVNLVLLAVLHGSEIQRIIFAIDRVAGIIFLLDFIRRLNGAKNKKYYFLKQKGWADLLASIPFAAFNIFRLFRIYRFVRLLRVLGAKDLKTLLQKNLSDTALYAVFFLILLLLEFGSIAVLYAERGAADANILTASDAIWWTFVSITTVGYGDRYPTTDPGRLVGIVTLSIGVGLFGVATGYVANAFMGNRNKS